jgi:hypothetical protein
VGGRRLLFGGDDEERGFFGGGGDVGLHGLDREPGDEEWGCEGEGDALEVAVVCDGCMEGFDDFGGFHGRVACCGDRVALWSVTGRDG